MTAAWRRSIAVFAGVASLVLGGGTFAHAANGTSLAVVADAEAPVCSTDNTSATVEINAAVTSTASAAPLGILVSTDGGVSFTNLGTVANWTSNGRTKTAEETVQVSVAANVSTPVEVCFVQPGANGNAFKKACADVSVSPSCASGPPPICGPYNFGCTSNAECGGGAAQCLLCGNPTGFCVNYDACTGGSVPGCSVPN